MKPNMGSLDRVLRVVVVTAIAYLYFTNVITGAVGITLLVLAVVFALTAVVSFCPIYSLLGINTNSDNK